MPHVAVIIEVAGADPATDRFVFRRGDHAITVVLTGAADAVSTLAAELADELRADAIELCGGFGAVPQAAVDAAVAGRAAVGAVLYGFESLDSIVAFKTAFEDGGDLPGGFLLLLPGADPATDRATHTDGQTKSTIVAVPDVATAGQVARELAADGARLFELYAGLGAAGAAEVLRTTGGDVPVGVASYDVVP